MHPSLVPCRGCDTMVVWGEWEKTGRRMCGEEDPEGDLILVDGWWVRYAPETNPWHLNETRYTSHFVTCPKAKQFRK